VPGERRAAARRRRRSRRRFERIIVVPMRLPARSDSVFIGAKKDGDVTLGTQRSTWERPFSSSSA
jgi:hypothetical protein